MKKVICNLTSCANNENKVCQKDEIELLHDAFDGGGYDCMDYEYRRNDAKS
jgi:hypothetical protein